MAIQMRRGEYADFVPSKMVTGEFAVVVSGDPAASAGRSVYICFEPGSVKRLTTYEDFETELTAASEEVREMFTDDIKAAIKQATDSAEAADTATEKAETAARAANDAAQSGIKSVSVSYQASESGTTAPTGTWSSSPPTVDEGMYLWTRVVITYNSGSTTTYYSIGKMGTTGGISVSYDSSNKNLTIYH